MDVVSRARQARPHLVRAAIAGLVLTGAFVAGIAFGDFQNQVNPDAVEATDRVIAVVAAVVVLLTGVVMVRALARSISAAAGHAPHRKSSALSLIVSVVGYFIVGVLILAVLEVPTAKLLLGGALAGVAIGIAAQQTLGNFFAGILLVLVRPFDVGEKVFLKSGLGEYDGVVTEMGLFYLKMVTDGGPVALPNTAVISSAVGPGARPKPVGESAEDGSADDKETEGKYEAPEKAADPSRRSSEPA
jgi:small-conductance mechanosensitive channel